MRAEWTTEVQRLQKSGMRKLSRTAGDSRFLPDRRGFTLGYSALYWFHVTRPSDYLDTNIDRTQALANRERLSSMDDPLVFRPRLRL